MSAMKPETTDGLQEEYYQITPDLLSSFNKYRPPLDLYTFLEDVGRVAPFYKKGGRLSNEQVEQLANLVNEGVVFVSRADHPVYVKHMSYQLDLVLVDKNLTEREIADIFSEALIRRLEEFFDQPVKAVLDKLWADLLVLTEYLWADIHRIRALSRRLRTQHTLANHSFNTGVIGLLLFQRLRAKEFDKDGVKRSHLDRLAAGLFLHDLGMSKIPAFLREKQKPLTREEKEKVVRHPSVGYEMLAKFDLKYPEVEDCVLGHHERLNGTGYPQKLAGEKIGFAARLCALADSYCAMISARPHAGPMEPAAAAAALSGDLGYDQEMARQLQGLVVMSEKKKSAPAKA